MITTVVVWFAVLAAASGYGRLVFPGKDRRSLETEMIRVYAGLLILPAILLAAAFFVNLTPVLGVVALLPGLALGFRRPSREDFGWAVLYVAIALFVCAREINFYDTALYHQQAVKWLSEHGLVRGLALVYFRFGWISSWFALAAPLNHGALAGRTAAAIGGLPFAFVVVSVFRILAASRPMPFRLLSFSMLGIMLAAVAITWNVDASLSPDFVMWLTPALVLTILTDYEQPEMDRVGRATLVSALACLVKPTAAPVLLYCGILLLWLFVRNASARRRLTAYGAAAGAVIGVMIAANVLLSGCPFFPSPVGCLGTEWSVGANSARAIQAIVQEFAHAPRHDQIFPLLAVAALASAFCFLRERTGYVNHAVALAWTGIVLICIAAPVPRYGLGYLLLPVACAAAFVFEWLTALRFPLLNRRLTAVPATIVVLAGVALVEQANATAWVFPPKIAAATGDPIHIVNRVTDVRGVLSLHARQYDGFTIWTPTSSDQCWDAPLPCTPELPQSSISPRRAGSLDAGFVVSR